MSSAADAGASAAASSSPAKLLGPMFPEYPLLKGPRPVVTPFLVHGRDSTKTYMFIPYWVEVPMGLQSVTQL